MNNASQPLRIGIGGPVGSGKTALTLALCLALREKYNLAVVTNDIYTEEDAQFLVRNEALEPARIIGVETGGCPHTAIREDASINLEAVDRLNKRFPGLDVIFVESGGDNLAATFSPELSDLTIYVIDVAAGEKIPRKGGPGITKSDLPDFMVFLDWKELPWYWAGSDSFVFSLFLALALPALVAYVFGYFAFRSRIKGVYFSIITQALTFAAMLLFFRNETGFGGNNGFTDFKRILGYDITSPEMRATLFGLSALVLMLTLLLGRWLTTSKYGRVLAAIRDAESRVMFIGYNPLHYKLFVWTLSAALCGIAGALYVPQVGIINPGEMSPANSIEIAIWVAVGGRGTLIGPVIGAWLVNLFKSYFTVAFPEYWLFFLGALFVGVTLWLPEGVVGLWKKLRNRGAA